MTEPIEAPGRRVNRRVLALAAAAVVLVLVVLVPRLLSGGGGDSPSPTSAPPAFPSGAPPTTAPTGGGAGSPTRPPETFEVFATKNPFLPLRGPAGVGAPATGAPGAGAAGGGAGTGGAGGGQPAGGQPAGTGGNEPRRGERVAVTDIFVEGGRTVAQVRVNDTVYKVSPGQVFASRFKVMSLSQAERCGRFLFGDDSFRLCKGEQTLK